MNIRWTSRLSLAQEIPRLKGLRLEVYTAIKAWNPAIDGPGPTREQLAEKLNRKECSICARISELLGHRYEEGQHIYDPELASIQTSSLVINPKSGKQAETFIALDYREDQIKPAEPKQGQFLLFPDLQPSEKRISGAFQTD